MENKYILFDCDTGSDDAIAMMMLLQATNEKKVETVGITCVAGNTPLSNVVMNNLRLLKLYDLIEKVPLYKGCHEAFVDQTGDLLKNTGFIHGSDGMGGVPDLEPKSSDELFAHVQAEHAASAIVKFANKYNKQLTIVATGPLTNLALALKLDPDLPGKLQALYIMGGTREGFGNITPAGEFNFFIDPEAAFLTMRAFPPLCKTHLIDYGFCTGNPISFTWLADWIGKCRNQKEAFAAGVTSSMVKWSADVHGERGVVICDTYAMALVLDATIASPLPGCDVCVELGGNISRGHIVWNKTGRKCENFYGPVILYENLDREKYQAMLKKAVV